MENHTHGTYTAGKKTGAKTSTGVEIDSSKNTSALSSLSIGQKNKLKLLSFCKLLLVTILVTPILSSCVLQARKTNTAPSIRIISPQDTEVFVASALRISMEAEDAEQNINTVKLYQNGEILGDASPSLLAGQTQDPTLPERWHFNWTAPENGSYNISAEATDELGLKAMTSVSFEVQVPATTPPTTPVDSEAYQSFIDNKTLWESQNIKNYEVDFQRICFCLPDITQPAKLTVINQFLSDAIYLSGATVNQNNFFHFYTINKAFSLIQEAFNEGAAEIRVVYDIEHGFPKSAFIDYDERLADEELQFRFSNLISE